MLSSIKSFLVFLKGYWYILKYLVVRAMSLFVRHTGKVETCYGGVQTTLFAGVTFLSYSKHQLNNIADHIDEHLENKLKK